MIELLYSYFLYNHNRIRTAKELGVKTVAIYSNIDGSDAIHAKMADEAYQIGSGPSPGESYLRGEEVSIMAVKKLYQSR